MDAARIIDYYNIDRCGEITFTLQQWNHYIPSFDQHSGLFRLFLPRCLHNVTVNTVRLVNLGEMLAPLEVTVIILRVMYGIK
jgi:hypothetical protein